MGRGGQRQKIFETDMIFNEMVGHFNEMVGLLAQVSFYKRN